MNAIIKKKKKKIERKQSVILYTSYFKESEQLQSK